MPQVQPPSAPRLSSPQKSATMNHFVHSVFGSLPLGKLPGGETAKPKKTCTRDSLVRYCQFPFIGVALFFFFFSFLSTPAAYGSFCVRDLIGARSDP